MNAEQIPVHAARRAADRLAIELHPSLPIMVDDVLAREREEGHMQGGDEPRQGGTAAATLVAGSATLGWRTLQDLQPKARVADDVDLWLSRAIRAGIACPNGMTSEQYGKVVETVVEELLKAHRIHGPRT